jgi:hypothetical protein
MNWRAVGQRQTELLGFSVARRVPMGTEHVRLVHYCSCVNAAVAVNGQSSYTGRDEKRDDPRLTW